MKMQSVLSRLMGYAGEYRAFAYVRTGRLLRNTEISSLRRLKESKNFLDSFAQSGIIGSESVKILTIIKRRNHYGSQG